MVMDLRRLGGGHAEEVVGRALDGREDVLVSTSGTLRRDAGDDTWLGRDLAAAL